jgi:hypothetical protein
MEQTIQNQTIWFGNGPEYPHHTITNIVPFEFSSYPGMHTHEGLVHLQDGSYIVYKYSDDDVWFVAKQKEETDKTV